MILPSLGGRLLHQRTLSRPLPFVTFRSKSCQCDGIGLALCETRTMRRTPLRTPAELPTPAGARECPAAPSLTRLGNTVPAATTAPAPPRDNCLFLSALASILGRNDTCSGHDSEASHHFCCAVCRSRHCFSTDLTSSFLGPAPTPVSAPFAFSVWAIARLTSLTSSPSSCIAAPNPSFFEHPWRVELRLAVRCWGFVR